MSGRWIRLPSIAAALGRSVPRIGVPGGAALALATVSTTVRKWLADDVYDGTRFDRAFSFRAEVDLAKGLAREVAWY